MTRPNWCWLLTILFASLAARANAVTVQDANSVFDPGGRAAPFLWVEAESFASLGADDDANGWTVVSTTNPIVSTQGVDILPATSNVSGTALLDLPGGGQHSDTALYEVQFLTAGTYQLYTRHTMFDNDGNGNFGNEDSVFLSPAFNLNSESDWVGFNGLDFDESDVNVDIPNPGFALDPDGFKPSVGDSGNDGWYAIRDWGVKSNGNATFPNDATTNDWNGNFNWYNRPAYVSSGSGGGFDGDFGFKTEYTVTTDMVGQVVTFEMGTREPYGAFDGFLFIQDDNVDLLDNFSQGDLDQVLPTVKTVQTPDNVFDGRAYLWVEAENFASRGDDADDNGWKVVSKENPITSTQGLDILPASSNVSGTALLDDQGGGQHSDTAVYEVQFITPGTYQLYTRHSMFDVDGNGNFGNEDSFFVSPAFDHNSSSDWVGFEGLDFDESDVNVDIPNPGFALDPDGFKPATGDSENDGWFAIRDWGVKSEGNATFPNDATTDDWNGNFNWYNRPAYVSSGAGGGFDGDFGFKTEFVVTEEMINGGSAVGDYNEDGTVNAADYTVLRDNLGEMFELPNRDPSNSGPVNQADFDTWKANYGETGGGGSVTLTFEIGTREPYGVIDGFLFIQDDNVDLLDIHSQADLDQGILGFPASGDSSTVPEPTSLLLILVLASSGLVLRVK